MFARKFNSDGRIRCPTPCRARKATRLPRNVPSTYGPDGSPNGVERVLSSRSVSSAMSYSPLPPMIPILISPLMAGSQCSYSAVTDMLEACQPGSPLVHEEWGDNIFVEFSENGRI